jgi:hypothetical protein
MFLLIFKKMAGDGAFSTLPQYDAIFAPFVFFSGRVLRLPEKEHT